jgi:hypothetical protein
MAETKRSAEESAEHDRLVRARFRGHDTFFLIHVENQATSKSGFPARIFHYFARLHEKYGLPVYPVVIFSYESRAEMTVYDQEVAKVSPPERKAIMQIVNEWEARGEARGRRLGELQ